MGERVAPRTQLEVDRQIVKNLYRRQMNNWSKLRLYYFTNKVEDSKTIQRLYSD